MKKEKKQKDTGRKMHVLRREDFTGHALALGIWQELTEEHGLSHNAKEIEIVVNAINKVV